METLRSYGFDLNPMSLGVGAVIAAISYFIINNYLSMSKEDEKENDYIIIYSVVPSIIMGILAAFVYSKFCNGGFQKNNNLLQEDFFQ